MEPTSQPASSTNCLKVSLISTTAKEEDSAVKFLLEMPMWSHLNLNTLHKLKVRHKLKLFFQSHFLRITPTDLSFYLSGTMIFGRVTKTNKLASGPLKKSILVKIQKIGLVSQRTSNISSNMSLPFSLLVMELFLKTWLKDS
jgi:hypothetical protein